MKLTELPLLNFPENYKFRFKQSDEINFIFCPVRKKWLILTAEEWVRQHVVQFLIHEKKHSKSAVNTEVIVQINGMKKRADVVVFEKEKPLIIVECKAPQIKITQETFDQIARYNLELNTEYLMVTNGLNHFYCQMDYENSRYVFLENLPEKLS
jgi:hypothetical protein